MVMHPIRGVFTSSVAPMPIIVQLNLSRGRFTTRSLIFECLQLRNFECLQLRNSEQTLRQS